MKTQAVLEKYQKVIGGLLKIDPKRIGFFVGNNEIKEIEYFEPEKDDKGNETGKQIRRTYWNGWSEGDYTVKIIGSKESFTKLATFELYKLPHCCAILVSCKAWVNEQYRGKRVGTLLNNFRQDIGRLLGYSTLMCTDIESNIHQRQLLKTNNWRDIYSVINKRTKNRVFISVIDL